MDTEAIRARLDAVAPPTTGRLSEAEFLLAGAAAGLVGWSGTQLAAWSDSRHAALLATVLWAVLIAGFAGGTVRHGPASIRFSDAMLAWGTVNGTASGLAVAGLLGVLPGWLAVWQAWVAAAAIGYCWTAGLLEQAGYPGRGRGYLGAGVVALGVLVAGTLRPSTVTGVAYLLLAAIHAVPLVLDARTRLSPLSRGGTLLLCVLAVVGAGTLL